MASKGLACVCRRSRATKHVSSSGAISTSDPGSARGEFSLWSIIGSTPARVVTSSPQDVEDEVLAIHARLIEVFGGPEGVRDPGLLESALRRPQTGYYADVAEMATALFESLLMNHPFVDGNKRVAFFATDVLLRMKGWTIQVDADSAHSFLIGSLEEGRADSRNLLSWIRARVARRT